MSTATTETNQEMTTPDVRGAHGGRVRARVLVDEDTGRHYVQMESKASPDSEWSKKHGQNTGEMARIIKELVFDKWAQDNGH